MWVGSLVGELRSHMPYGAAKKKKKKKKKVHLNAFMFWKAQAPTSVL